jgi:hypothetical protein
MERELPSHFIRGTTLCPIGHDNTAGARFCAECGISMTERKQIGEVIQLDDPAPAVIITESSIPLQDLHVATLKKMCRGKGLPDKGSKAQLIERLA